MPYNSNGDKVPLQNDNRMLLQWAAVNLLKCLIEYIFCVEMVGFAFGFDVYWYKTKKKLHDKVHIQWEKLIRNHKIAFYIERIKMVDEIIIFFFSLRTKTNFDALSNDGFLLP